MPQLNETWHRQNALAESATRDDRLLWHVEHDRVCGCGEVPLGVADDIKHRGLHPGSLVVDTSNGPIVGGLSGSVRYFFGIPYAAPPVGELRWRQPQPVEPWKEPRRARSFGNPCMQTLDVIPVIHERQRTPSEDCLYLNVWAPIGARAERLPVMLWLHGGAFVAGSGSAAEFDGGHLAERGLIVVTLNYRLGPFGFFAHTELATESPNETCGNYGLLDQLAALRWVRDNIAAFGGDPDNVTIVGQSAGGISVSCLVASPHARGLFAKAISQSATWFTIPGGLPDAHSNRADAARDSERFATKLGCRSRGRVVSELRTRPAEDLLAATDGRALFSPIQDGWLLAQDPADQFTSGEVTQVPYLLGYTANEGTRFTHAKPGSERDREFTDRVVVQPLNRVAAGIRAPIYRYRFDRVPNTALAREFGAYHGIEVPYLFGNLSRAEGYDQLDDQLSQTIMGYWGAFFRRGDPNHASAPAWPRWAAPAEDGTLVLDAG